MRRKRRAGVSVLVVLCGIAIAVGAFLTWIDARGARPASGVRHTSITGLLRGNYQTTSSLLHSVALVVAVAGVLVFIGGLVASRFVGVLFSLVTLAAAGLWIGLNASHYHTTDLPYSDLRYGAWLVVGGGLIGLIFSFLLRRSARRQQNAWSP